MGMSLVRPVVAAVVLAVLAPGAPGATPPASAAPASLRAVDADPSLGTLVSGEQSYVDGTHVWTDYVYDDRGPNTDALPGGDEPSRPDAG